MFRVRQRFPAPAAIDVAAELARQAGAMAGRIARGQRVAVGVGSRGISRLPEIVAAVLAELRRLGAEPFIVPAMGSHGGATPEGQLGLLREYGITEASLGVPIRPAMDVDRVGLTEDGLEVVCSREALRADWILAVNRIKPHTDFRSTAAGSGLQKMLVVGFGKQVGAANYHRAAVRLGFETVLQRQAAVMLRHPRVLGGVAIVEDQRHALARVEIVPVERLAQREAELLAEAHGLMPQLPLNEIDLLIVDRMGKNISGTGMDANVIGREVHGYSTSFEAQRRMRPAVKRLFVRDLTPQTQGNAIGIGMADFTTARLVRAMDPRKTRLNALTALSLNAAKIPIQFDTDREALLQAFGTLALREGEQPAIVRIKDTLSLEEFSASGAAVDRLRAEVDVLGPDRALEFDPAGNLSD
jgi:hypothetical protein